MAAKPFHPVVGVLMRPQILAGSVTTDGSGAVYTQSGTGITWTKTGTGEYTGTFHAAYQAIPIASVVVNSSITRVDVTVSTTAVVVTNNPSGTPTDLASGTIVAMVYGETL